MDYGIKIWSKNYFKIKDGKVIINHGKKPAIVDIVKDVRSEGYKGPLLIRFPHLIKNQIDTLFESFEKSMKEYSYNGKFNGVFPLKVNQFPNFVIPLTEISQGYNYGLEAGSKPELIIAMSYTNLGSPIIVNGFKDKEMITLGFIAAQMGHDITITIEGINELETILEVAKEMGSPYPNIGLRIRLHSSGIGIWAKSGGINSKFGLTSAELVEAMTMLKQADMLENFKMIHFHIGSQISEISPMKKALREAGNIYAELYKMGATNLNSVDLGGGLAVEYSQHKGIYEKNYTLEEFTSDVVYLLKMIAQNKKVPEPDIYIEAGRFIAASHAIVVAPVLELFSQEYDQKELNLKEKNPPLIDELYELYKIMNENNAIEFLHDSLDHMESLLTLFDLGYIDLIDRSNTEILVHLIIKKAVDLLRNKDLTDIINIQNMIQERYLLNFSIFQSLPDYWGLGQNFPVMPLEKLDEKPTRSASLWDITCDSDGEISFDTQKPLFLHDVNLIEEDYFLCFFLVGAYQETMGMQHNLFTHPTELTVDFDEEGNYEIKNIIEAQNILDILDDMDYDIKDVERRLKQKIEESKKINDDMRSYILGKLYVFLSENCYLKTIAGCKND
ncbi:biosynthetic arginine decarboxylase [Deferribacterales bacterium Es71-Z0220]|jgi:arginine decarboxylase|uniref:biosynthetic arginine decarboxylase n=1 Tax=Deferrivibrio essentukiensis TaxID=2880922 RepID=UPI001F60E860|nr:biosynthetic arginine decarboxylase [Deferrivibrio essentukiensis]MBZ4672177.1 arginine decarboxylase [Deferribacteraceae bacterium]MCB4204924.1 biosynthetic arginine decarboxylase [Deferrivibrio essentukiensis]